MNPCGNAVDYQGGREGLRRLYPFNDQPDRYILAYFYRVPLDGPYIPFPTIFNVREWEALDYHGRTPLGTDQNFRQPVIGIQKPDGSHEPFGDPDLWLNGWSFAAWEAGELGGDRDCECPTLNGGGAGGGGFQWMNCCRATVPFQSTLHSVWLNWDPQITPFGAIPPPTILYRQPFISGNNFAGPYNVNVVGLYLALFVSCDTEGFSVDLIDTPYVAYGNEIEQVSLTCDPFVLVVTMGVIPFDEIYVGTVVISGGPIICMSGGGAGGGGWDWDSTYAISGGGAGGRGWSWFLAVRAEGGGAGGGGWEWM